MIFRYAANPLRDLAGQGVGAVQVEFRINSLTVDPLGYAVFLQDANTALRQETAAAILLPAYKALGEVIAGMFDAALDNAGRVVVRPVTALNLAQLEGARQYDALVSAAESATRTYLATINTPPPASSVLNAVAFSRAVMLGTVTNSATFLGASTCAQRRDECLARLAVLSVPVTPVTPIPATDPVAARLAAWRGALSDARRLETDASNILAALNSIRQAWQEAGNFPDQLRTLDGLIADAVANVDGAKQAAATLTALIAVGETVQASGTGSMPPDPVFDPLPPLPSVLPARPDGTRPVVTPAISVPTAGTDVAADSGPVVQGGSKPNVLAWLTAALTLLTLFN